MSLEIRISADGVKFSNPHYGESEIANREDNDCVVRAVAASFGVSYDEAHAFAKEYLKRKDRKGTQATAIYLNEAKEQWGKEIVELKEVAQKWDGPKTKSVTVGAFISRYPKGNYIVLVRGHAFAVVDGVVVGNYDDGLKMKVRIHTAFRIGEEVDMADGQEVKKCISCGEVHPHSEFRKASDRKDGRGPRCHKCHAEWKSSEAKAKRKLNK